MHTRIAIDDELIKRAMQSTGLSNKGAVISLALQTLLDQSGPGPAAELTGWPSRSTANTEADAAESWTDLEYFLSRLNRHVDFNLFAAQLGLSEKT